MCKIMREKEEDIRKHFLLLWRCVNNKTDEPKNKESADGIREKMTQIVCYSLPFNFYKSGSILWISEERKYSDWNVYSALASLPKLFILVWLMHMHIDFDNITYSGMPLDHKQSNRETHGKMKVKQNSQYLRWCLASQWTIHHSLSTQQLFPIQMVCDVLSTRPIRVTANN